MSKISYIKLGELIEFQRGFDLPKSEFKNGNVPVISSNGILGYHNQHKVNGPGITIGRSGTVGLPHFIDEDFFPHNTTLFIKDFKGNYPKYIFYLLKTLSLNNRGSGSGVPTMNRNHLHPLKVYAHLNYNDQKAIAKVLSDLDAKIELNNKINKELEAMAKTLYDYWFVQFDFPFDFAQGNPDENGKPYKSSGGKMVYNAELKREIPEGWEVKKLGEIVYQVNDNISPHVYPELPYLPIDKLPMKQLYYSEYEDRSEANSSLIRFQENDILLGAMRVYFHRVCHAISDGISRSTIIVLRPFNNKLKSFALFTLNKNEAIEFATNYSTGSSIPYAKWTNSLEHYLISVPKNENILVLFNKITEPILEKFKILNKQNQQLAELRDLLLPMLMNGQVTVSELIEDTVITAVREKKV